MGFWEVGAAVTLNGRLQVASPQIQVKVIDAEPALNLSSAAGRGSARLAADPVISNSSCGLDQTTVPYGQLLRPYPQYCGVDELQPPGASSWYHATTVQFNHRFNHGVQVLASYTWSKYLDNSQGMQQWVSGPASSVRNWYDLASEKSVDANDVPHSLVVSFIAQVPFGKGKAIGSNWGRVANAVAGGWELSGVGSFKAGLPLGIYAVTNNTNSFGGGQRPNIAGNPGVVPAGTDRVNEWFNTAAFQQPSAFTFGNASRFLSTPRAPGLQNVDLVFTCINQSKGV